MSNDELPEWTTEMDEEILRALKSEMILTPAIIAENIERSREAVSRRLNTLEAGGLVRKVERGKYRITNSAWFIVAEKSDISDEERRRLAREEHEQRKSIMDELGLGVEEYQRAVEREFSKIMQQEDETSESWEKALKEAFRRVDEK